VRPRSTFSFSTKVKLNGINILPLTLILLYSSGNVWPKNTPYSGTVRMDSGGTLYDGDDVWWCPD
jgi:hypothetical protein